MPLSKRSRQTQKKRRSGSKRKQRGGEFPWIELPSEIKLLNLISEDAPIWETRGRVPKPYTPAVLIDDRVYILLMWSDDEEADREPYPVYYYAGNVGGPDWKKSTMKWDGVEYPIVIYTYKDGSTAQYRYSALDRSKGDLIGRKFPFAQRGGLEWFQSTKGLNGFFMTADYKAGRSSNPIESFATDSSYIVKIINEYKERFAENS